MSKLVYIAGPYTNPDPIENINKAVVIADHVYEASNHFLVPLIPHSATLAWQMIKPHTNVQFWYDYDIEIMLRCDAVFRFDGSSTGADNEVQVAAKAHLPIFYDLGDLFEWKRYLFHRENI